MNRIVFDTVWFYIKQFVMMIGLTMVSLIILVELSWLNEDDFLVIIPYVLVLFFFYVIVTLMLKWNRSRHNMSLIKEQQQEIISPLPIIAMIFTSVIVKNATIMVLGFDTPLEGQEAFFQIIILALLIAVLVFMLLSSRLKQWWSEFEFETLFQHFVESTSQNLFRWISILFTLIVIGIGLISLILSITLEIETGLDMHVTFIKVFGAVFVLAIIARFIHYRKKVAEGENDIAKS